MNGRCDQRRTEVVGEGPAPAASVPGALGLFTRGANLSSPRREPSVACRRSSGSLRLSSFTHRPVRPVDARGERMPRRHRRRGRSPEARALVRSSRVGGDHPHMGGPSGSPGRNEHVRSGPAKGSSRTETADGGAHQEWSEVLRVRHNRAHLSHQLRPLQPGRRRRTSPDHEVPYPFGYDPDATGLARSTPRSSARTEAELRHVDWRRWRGRRGTPAISPTLSERLPFRRSIGDAVVLHFAPVENRLLGRARHRGCQ